MKLGNHIYFPINYATFFERVKSIGNRLLLKEESAGGSFSFSQAFVRLLKGNSVAILPSSTVMITRLLFVARNPYLKGGRINSNSRVSIWSSRGSMP